MAFWNSKILQISAHSCARHHQCMTCSCWICHHSNHLHLESSKQNYHIISLWAIIKAIFIHFWVCADTYLRVCAVQPLHQRHLLRHKIFLHCRTFHWWPQGVLLDTEEAGDAIHVYMVKVKQGKLVTRWIWTLKSFRLWVGHAGERFGIVRPFEMKIHITSRGWIESWKSSAPVHVRGLETLYCVV